MASFQARGRDPLFDSSTALVLEKRGRELVGLVMVALGLACAAMILSYTPDDPSWMSATDAPVQNWMGRLGAFVAAPLFMIVGLGAWALSASLLIWGGRLVLHRGEGRPFLCVILTPVWMLLCSVYAAGLTQGAGWTHHFGLGGLFGDMVMGSFLTALPLAPAVGLKLMMLVLGLGILILGLFVLGFTRAELRAIARFLVVSVVLTYAAVVKLLGRGGQGALGAAQRMQAARSERQAERAAAAEAAAADAVASAPVTHGLPKAPRVQRAVPPLTADAGLPPLSALDELPHAPEDALDAGPLVAGAGMAPGMGQDMAQDMAPEAATVAAPAPKRSGLMSFIRRGSGAAASAPMPEAELVSTELGHDVAAPEADRISAKIASAVKTRRPGGPVPLTARKPDPSKPLTGGRGHGPKPLIFQQGHAPVRGAVPQGMAPSMARPAAAGLPPEPPLSAAAAGDPTRALGLGGAALRAAVPLDGGYGAGAGAPAAPSGPGTPPLMAPRRSEVPPVPLAEPEAAPAQMFEAAPLQDAAGTVDAHAPEAHAYAAQGYEAQGYEAQGYGAQTYDAQVLDDRAFDDPYADLTDFDDYGEPDADVGAMAAVPPAPPMPAPAPAPRVAPVAPKSLVQKPVRKPIQQSRRAKAEAQPQLQFEDHTPEYELPPLSLLMSPDQIERHHLSDEALEENARMLESVLDDYGVKGEITSVRPGPVVTMYELEPAPGLKASRVIGLADDIARSMSALSARVSTVPGRSVIGIELPNDNREMVCFREILAGRDYGDGKHKLPLALGKDIGGDPMVANLAKMPHLLIAGTTGSGKSVAINTMILSLLYKLTPDECRLIMIDPKMLELSVYDGIPHLLSPVVTDPKKAVVALKWVVGEMEDRYRKMSKMGVRNIDGYNGRVEDALKKDEMFSRTVQTGFDDETGEPVFETEEFEPKKMPYIVVIVDEMADLMMVAGKEIEACIQRLAQMARASGIHLIMATQRPSVDVITGTIKANFPTRISFQVTSKIDSRTILGEMGAEQLLGMGDMLYMAGGAKITRCHGPFVSDEEVEEIVNHLKAFGPPDYVGGVVEGPDEEKADGIDAVLGLNTGGNTGGEDALYDQAVAIVIKDRKCSTSYIQRKLGIGYNKAARLVEQMEDEGVVSAANHVGKREILVPEQ